ncbi:hypothetical protein M5W70_21340 [Paenibacillus larvae]|uniref:Uncharacterized protein n=3 Tax=Paenibacillus larvae TaxID=1464 RepID=A0AAP5JW57_9BACL|nr:hypothetical protein [Paenibacillus larvae]MCY9691134.1 hypothetical protein [Paenibacillus larvae]MDT2252670.1 hypothetical protein [Paenibacillus larvae]
MIEKLIRWTKDRRATINGVLVIAFFRSLLYSTICMEPSLSLRMVGITVDLRRYLPKKTTSSICNLSGMEMPIVELYDVESFEVTFNRVKREMDSLKNNLQGISSAARMELMAKTGLSALREKLNSSMKKRFK